MNTDELVALLAANGGAVDRAARGRRIALAAGLGVAGAFVLVAVVIGLRPGIEADFGVPMFWTRELFCAALGLSAVSAFVRLGRPGVPVGLSAIGVGLALACMWSMAAVTLGLAPPAQRLPLVLGQTWLVCPFLIALVSAPLFAAFFTVLRELAPTRLRLAGAAGGFAAGAVGALLYTLHCPELAAPFLAVWYVLGMLIPAALGALLGPPLLRW